MKNITYNKRRCCFAGHSHIYDDNIKELITEKVIELIEKYGVNEFWVGNYGAFDYYSASVIRELKKSYDIELDLVIPYTTRKIEEQKELYCEKYDYLLMADIPESTPAKFRITKCNQYMVDSSDFLICYVKYSWGGAVQTMKYAKKKKYMKVINLAE